MPALSISRPTAQFNRSLGELGPRGATTRASRNTEDNPFVRTYEEKRRLERLEAIGGSKADDISAKPEIKIVTVT